MNAAARSVAVSAALLSLVALVLAAMGSHLFDLKGFRELWNTASGIHLFNAAALIGVSALLAHMSSPLLLRGAWLIILGTIVFCGSIYLHAITGHAVPAVTPLGGLLMMTGWLLVALALMHKS